MRLSVIVPVLNEITFVPLYIESAIRYADEIIIADGGSTDGTIEEIERLQRRYAIRLFHVSRAECHTPRIGTNPWSVIFD